MKIGRIMRIIGVPTSSALLAALALSTLLTIGVAPAGLGQTTANAVAQPASDGRVFDEAWRLIRDNFYKRDLAIDWDRIKQNLRPDYDRAKSPEQRAAVINRMLDQLGASHTRLYTKADPAYYQLMDIFANGLRQDLPRLFPGGKVVYPGIGIFTRDLSGKVFVSGLLEGLPGAQAGLLVGDEILSADGQPFAAVESFRNKVGKPVELRIRRSADAAPMVVTVKPELIQPNEAFLTAQRRSARLIEVEGKRIGYIKIWSYAGRQYQDALAEELASGKLKDADAVIWDLRDGWGGAQPSYLDIFNPRGPVMTLRDRDGEEDVVNFRWRKPVTLLINAGTRSGKEVLTFGFKKYGYGEVIGERTAGALLAARGFVLSDDSLMIIAVDDVAVDGERLEGRGVEPTIRVPFDLPYAAGRDPQLDRAVRALTG
jgi:C-terminal processing protease CtpA/Prc